MIINLLGRDVASFLADNHRQLPFIVELVRGSDKVGDTKVAWSGEGAGEFGKDGRGRREFGEVDAGFLGVLFVVESAANGGEGGKGSSQKYFINLHYSQLKAKLTCR